MKHGEYVERTLEKTDRQMINELSRLAHMHSDAVNIMCSAITDKHRAKAERLRQAMKVVVKKTMALHEAVK